MAKLIAKLIGKITPKRRGALLWFGCWYILDAEEASSPCIGFTINNFEKYWEF